MKKAVFFDIDGTLWDSNEEVPCGTIETIHRLKENGVYIFLCSGRGFAFIKNDNYKKALEELGDIYIYAFGDSVNDVDMIKYAAHGIAMGNGMQEAKDAADYITDGIHENGIYNACRHFSLI